MALWTSETKSDIGQLKAEPANGQSGKLSLTEDKLGNIAKTAQQLYLHGEKRVKIKKKRKKQNGEKREKERVEEKV